MFAVCLQIVHLKRFQFVNGKWVKSQKVVNFPFKDFDPTAYLASVPKHTVVRHKELERLKVAEEEEEEVVNGDVVLPLNGGQEAIISREHNLESAKVEDETEDEVIVTRKLI